MIWCRVELGILHLKMDLFGLSWGCVLGDMGCPAMWWICGITLSVESHLRYLATVFAKMTNQEEAVPACPLTAFLSGLCEVVRQRAGLLLKTNVSRVPPGMLQPAVAEYVQANALSAMRDSSKVIRHTAGTVISILVLKVGIVGSRQTLEPWP